MTIKNYDFKFIYTAENAPLREYPSDHEIMIRINAILVFPDLAGDYVDIDYILEEFERRGLENPTFMYDKIFASKDIPLSKFIKEWEPDDPFGIQVIKDSDLGGYHPNFNTPRDVIPKKR